MESAAASALASGVPVRDHHFLLASLLDCSLTQLLVEQDREVATGLCERYFSLEQRLRQGEPPQYLVGRTWFHGFELEVRPGVLIPRPETEGLVELALSLAREGDRVLDLGTGSGAIAIALKAMLPSLILCASDLDPAALELARGNASRNGCEISFEQADLFPAGVFDLVVSNPPYVSQAEYQALESRVRLYEPALALVGGEDGLELYRRIFHLAPEHLSERGRMVVEHGWSQRGDLLQLAAEAGFELLAAKEDLAGRDRCLAFGMG
jgi:release factor glutamine methyltransferase